MAHVKKMVVITESLYNNLLLKNQIKKNSIASVTEIDPVFNNQKTSIDGLDALRQEKEKEDEEAGGEDGNLTTQPVISVRPHPSFRDESSLQQPESEYNEQEQILEGIKNLAPAKMQHRITLMAKRLVNDPNVELTGNKIFLRGKEVSLLNLFDFISVCVSQRKPDYIQNLDFFIDFLYESNFPTSYFQNKYIRASVNELREKKVRSPQDSPVVKREPERSTIGEDPISSPNTQSRVPAEQSPTPRQSTPRRSVLHRVLPSFTWYSDYSEVPPEVNDDFD